MVRVVCQVSARDDHWTFVWSEGDAFFAPYILDGPRAAELRRLAGHAHEQLAQLGAATADAAATARTGHQLAQIGQTLYRLLFEADQPAGATGQQVRDWLLQRLGVGTIERLDFLGDCLGVPWTVLCEQAPDQAEFARSGLDGDCWKAFWGRRYRLFGGRRVQTPRGRAPSAKPAAVLAIDPELRVGLPHEEQKRLSDFIDAHAPTVVESREGLAKALATQQIDVLYFFGRFEDGALSLGAERLSAADLGRLLAGAAVDDGDPLLVLNPTRAGGAAGSGVLSAFGRFAGTGLVGPWQPLAGPVANRWGLAFLERLLYQDQPAAEALRGGGDDQAALCYFACCPAELRLAGSGETTAAEREPLPLPDAPYKLLAPLDVDDAALLVGREADIPRAAGLLDESATRLLLVHGTPGAGKSSLFRAGVVPFLEETCVGYRALRDRSGDPGDELTYPVLAVRATRDLAGQLALAVIDFCARPLTYTTPAGTTVTVDLPALLTAAATGEAPPRPSTAIQAGEPPASGAPAGAGTPEAESLRVALLHEPALLGRVLTTLSQQLPFELVLLVEQADDLFSLLTPGGRGGDTDAALAMLQALADSPARARLVLSLRTEYLGRLVDALDGHGGHAGVRTFLVPELTQEQLVEVILQPTSTEPLPGSDEVPVQKYGFQFEQGLAESLATEAVKAGGNNQEAVLPLLHVVCTRLWLLVKQRQDKVIRAADLKYIGGVDKGLSKYFASVVKQAPNGRDRRALNKLVYGLFVRQPDGSLTRDLLPEGELKKTWAGATPLEALAPQFAAEGVRLLEVSWQNVGGREDNFVSLAHDALAPVAAQQAEEAARSSYGWAKMTDVLWITIPLLILLGVFAYTRVRNAEAANGQLADELEQAKEIRKRMESIQNKLVELAQAERWPAYLNQVRGAEEAFRNGDLVRMRQALFTTMPYPTLLDEGGRPTDYDLRGFEWYYLWNLLHQDRATLLGHRDTVTAAALTADGLTGASGSEDGTVRVWDTSTGRLLREVAASKGAAPVRALAFSPDGALLAIAAGGGPVRVVDAHRLGKPYPPFFAAVFAAADPVDDAYQKVRFELGDKDAPEALALAFSPDSKTVAVAGADGAVKLWDVSGDKAAVRHTLTDAKKPLQALAYSPDGKMLAAGGADKDLHVWEAATGKSLKVLPAPAGGVAALAWSPDGKTLAVGSGGMHGSYESGVVDLLDTTSWQPRKLPQLRVAPVWGLAFTGDGKTLVVAAKDNALHLCDAGTGQETQVLRGHLGWVRALAAADGGKLLLSGSYDHTVKLWEPELLARRDLLRVSAAPVTAVAFSPDDRRLATAGDDGPVKLWDVATGKETKALTGHQGGLLAVAWANAGKALAAGGADGKLHVWDADDESADFGKELAALPAHDKGLLCLATADEGKLLASGGADGKVIVWTFKDGVLDKAEANRVTIDTGAGPVLDLAVLDDGSNLLVTGHEDGTVRFWNAQTGKAADLAVTTVAAHHARVTAVAFGGHLLTKQSLLTASADGTFKEWEVGKNTESALHRAHGGPVTALAMGRAKGGAFFPVTGGTDQAVKVWDLNPQRQEERLVLTGHSGPVRAVAVSGDGRLIASAGQDGTVRLWRAAAPESSLRFPMRTNR
jgi:WD40 repeat protein